MVEVKKIFLLLCCCVLLSSVYANGDKSEMNKTSYEIFFENLTLKEKVNEYIVRFSENSGQSDSEELTIAMSSLCNEVDPYCIILLKEKFQSINFIYERNNGWWQLKDVSGLGILILIDRMVHRYKTVSLDEGYWFGKSAKQKMLDYLQSFKQIDEALVTVFFYVLRLTDESLYNESLQWKDSEWGAYIYNQFVISNPEISSSIKILRPYVFDGYSGEILELSESMLKP